MKRHQNPPRVTVHWHDSHSAPNGELTEEQLNVVMKPIELATTGWLVAEDKVGVMLAFEYFDANAKANEGLTNVSPGAYPVRGFHYITRAMIQRIEWLAPTKRKH